MALTQYQYITDAAVKGTLYLDPVKLPASLTPGNLGLVPADGTEVREVKVRPTVRGRGIHARMVTIKITASGKYARFPVGTIAAYNSVATGSTYRVTLKRGEVNNL